MRKQKAKSWEMISEGIVKIEEIEKILALKSKSISLPLLEVKSSPGVFTTRTIDIIRNHGKYMVVNNATGQPHKKNYKYLSCAIRIAVKDYKNAVRGGNWRLINK